MKNVKIADLNKFRILNRLKSVYRLNSVNDRKESSAEHSWSCLLLADLLIGDNDLKLDRLRVYELLLYHDIIEIEIGDTPLSPEPGCPNRFPDGHYQDGAKILATRLPKFQGDKYIKLFKELCEQKTPESKFVALIDQLDAVVHELDYKNDWHEWTKEFFVEKKIHYFKHFPTLKPLSIEMVEYLIDNKYLEDRNRYLVKFDEDKNLPQIGEQDFGLLFRLYTEPFMDPTSLNRSIDGRCFLRSNDKASYIVKNDKHDLYNGVLWEDPDVEMISNMDYMYCLPAWDWWINPMYDANNFRKEYLNHNPGKYGYTVIFVDNNRKRESQFKEIIKKEGFQIVEARRQYELNPIEFFLFYDYYMIFLPLKLAREINRMRDSINSVRPKEIYYILRGGYLLSELIDIPRIKSIFIDPNDFRGKIEGKYFIDDCIVAGRVMGKIGASPKSSFTLSCLDCAVPKSIYSKRYPNVRMDLPSDLLNMYTCRTFEKNPMLIGVDNLNNKTVYYKSLVRDKFINKIKGLCGVINLGLIVENMSLDLFNYGLDGHNNELFEKLEHK